MSAENKTFWKQFDILLVSLETNGLANIRDELNEAKGFVNGFPNGWERLLDELKRIELKHRHLFQPEHRVILYYLSTQLKLSLYPPY